MGPKCKKRQQKFIKTIFFLLKIGIKTICIEVFLHYYYSLRFMTSQFPLSSRLELPYARVVVHVKLYIGCSDGPPGEMKT